jgi:hypothetical protein
VAQLDRGNHWFGVAGDAMAIAAYLTDADTNVETSFSVVGASELDSLWKPIIRRRDLNYLGYLVTAGLSVDGENHAAICKELQILLEEIEAMYLYGDDAANPVFRCKRLLDAVISYGSAAVSELYIG